ncbi:cadherin-like domain-containing protein [Akkermansiaceae bacterium]|nr:cadherin-like domain-containing protein [Akkermansiaceae bacterium]
MKFLFTSAKASCLVGLLSLFSPSSVEAAASSEGSGEVAIYTEATGTDVLTTADFIHDFDTNDREDSGSFTRSGADITLNRPGHYLAIYNTRFDSDAANANTNNQRVEIQSHLTVAGSTLANGWSQGIIRRQNNQAETITSGIALIEAAASDVLQLHSFRTDTATVGSASRAANASAIQLIKLDEINMSYARLSLAANQAGPTNATAVKVAYDTTDELDAGFTHSTPGDLTLVGAGKYLVMANTYLQGATNRTSLVQSLTLNGSPISGSTTTAYLRGISTQNNNEGAAAIGMIIDATAGQVLSVEGLQDVGDAGGLAGMNYIGGRCALTVVKLPSLADGTADADPDFLRIRHLANQNVNTATDTALIFDTNDEVDAAGFTHDVSASTVAVQQDGDYLFLGSVYSADDGTQRGYASQGWSINGAARLAIGQTGRYTRNLQGADQFGNFGGLIASGLTTNDTVEWVSIALGNTGTNDANPVALQGVRISSLFTAPGFEVLVDPVAVSTVEGGATATYTMKLGQSPASGSITVTISPDAQSEVSSDGTNFFTTLDVIFSDTTPQTITVRPSDDAAVEGAHSSTIAHAITASSDLTNYPLSQPVPSVGNSIEDNDVVPVTAVADASTSNVSEDATATEAILAPQANLLANDTDGFANFVSASDSVSAFGAAVSVNSDGTFTYDPRNAPGAQMIATGATGVDTFSYTVQDQNGDTSTATVSITIDGANDVPSASDDNLNDGPLETDSSYINAVDLTGNDGILNDVTTTFTLPAGSDLRLFPGKVVNQSPQVGAAVGGGVAGNAFDGDTSTFTHTDADDNTVDHIWQVDFGQMISLENVTLFNRATNQSRFRDITVTVLNDSGGTVFTSALLNPTTDPVTIVPSLFVDFGGPKMGQTLVVTRTPDLTDAVNEGSILSLGEVTIIGSIPGTFSVVDEFLVASHDASTSLGTAGRWENIGSAGGTSADWVLGSGVTLNSSVTSAHAQISGAYEWDGTVDATATFQGTSINEIYGAAVDQNDSAIEIWAKLDAADLTQISTLFETGGGTGTGIVVDNGTLRVANGINVGAVSYDLVGDPDSVLLGAATAEFFQVVMVMDFTGDRTLLYVNGNLVGTASNGTTDWDGGDASGLGAFRGTNHGGFQNGAATTVYDTHFNGSMASFRVYSTGLSGAQVAQNYKAVNSGLDLDGDTISVVGVLDGTDAFVANGSPATLASGAIVTMNNATGGFDYNPNGAFTLTPGVTGTDTFTYRVSDGNGGTAEADVTVTITGVVTAVDDNLLAKENQMWIFFANALVGNDDELPVAATPYVSLTPANISGTGWTNTGTAGAAGNGGGVSSIAAQDLESNFGQFGQAATVATSASFAAIAGADATLEVWFKPTAGQTTKSTIFETGGNGIGFSLVFNPTTNEVIATIDGGTDGAQDVIATVGGVVTTDFNQVIVAFDLDGGAEVGAPSGIFEDIMTVYLNNDPTTAFDATADATIVDPEGDVDLWSGTDGIGINRVSGTSALNENFAGMVGEVAIVRAYERILTPVEMEMNYDAAVQAISSVSSPTAVEGSTVSLNADGSVTVDYSGVSLAPGASLMDSFTYTTAGGTATANILIEGNTLHEDWRFLYYSDIDNSGPGADSVTVANGLTNLQNFALDLDPTAAAGTLDVNAVAGTITTLGPPAVWTDPETGRIYLRHTRRTDFAAIPLTITDQFSREMLSFEDSAIPPAVIATGTGDSGAAIEAVQTEFPLILPSGGKGRYGRINVTTP